MMAPAASAAEEAAKMVSADLAAAWTPPPHPAPAWAALSDPFVLLVAFLAHHPILVGVTLVPAWLGLMKLFPDLTRDAMKFNRRRHIVTWAMVAFGVGNLVLGTIVANAMIYATGEAGSATITSAYQTGSVHNNQFIVTYQITIRKASGELVNTSFDDDEFNVFPSHNATLYPGTDSHFTVRYLRLAPTEFVIVGNDGSPWVRGRVPR